MPMSPDEENGLWRDVFNRQLQTITDRQDKIDLELAENTATTKRIEASTGELVELVKSWKGAVATADMVGRILKPLFMVGSALAAVGAWVWAYVMHGGSLPPPPPGVGR